VLNLAEMFKRSVQTILVDGADTEETWRSWRAADIFLTLADNIQETFGLTPIEAMAAGLPVIASDWSGYRDSIVNGKTGFLIPTIMPPANAGGWLDRMCMDRWLEDGFFAAAASQSTAVDISACADALATLADNPELRQRMGDAGRKRALENYDWPVIINQYRALWRELKDRRTADAELVPRKAGHPFRADPFQVFEAFATQTLMDEDRLYCAIEDPTSQFRRIASVRLSYFTPRLLIPPNQCEKICEFARTPRTILEFVKHMSGDAEFVRTTLVWLIKIGLLVQVPRV
jgi:hypothetical protein